MAERKQGAGRTEAKDRPQAKDRPPAAAEAPWAKAAPCCQGENGCPLDSGGLASLTFLSPPSASLLGVPPTARRPLVITEAFPVPLASTWSRVLTWGTPRHAAVPEPQPQLQPSPSPWGLSSPGERWQWMTSGQAYRPCGQCLSPDTPGYRPSPLSPQYYVGDVRERRPDCYTSIIRGRCAVHGGR